MLMFKIVYSTIIEEFNENSLLDDNLQIGIEEIDIENDMKCGRQFKQFLFNYLFFKDFLKPIEFAFEILFETTDNSCMAEAMPDLISENIYFSYFKVRSKNYANKSSKIPLIKLTKKVEK